ncbi:MULTISPECIES: ribosome small subunit-dependent GTPase A [unclassified Tenacibaculum]|uniref:ribosome small subunit-dependent GTPase A n=1 Tax=unclassified Tenacibaculum TaxID=2635139 RepID=UPI001F385CE6|nr:MULTISPECIES: ribosome small subunit-dependent GTPase A [unclassified Tenacibaculum]MCF2873636.1 ribosome small subunit-dependent GTPase A [Tenacibaculum sp. Cn5-1]MCF2933792.1 ribosome small subunit-dependent GTPase A [Tenacibaculum sp. Cn5-34]MCG7509626.1 ribosome small subunit-dependent GTPase A [Tenacibaculum sp. Cn5-46]
MTGTVYKSTGSWYWVKSNQILYKCRIKGKFRIKGIKSTNPIAVGDKVDFELETKNNEETGVISNIHERDNYIVRKSVNLSKQTHVIAANIDQVFLLITINNPPTFTTFIDRFLVTTEAYSIKTILVFNKIDSYELEQRAEVLYLKDIYEKIGYQCIEVSATKDINVDTIKNQMTGKVSMFAGHSGVGKTTLVNAIEPGLDLKTKEISEQYKQGKHTTTFAEMFDLSFDARIIDTPGIKGFGVVDMEKDELGDYFPEFFALKQDCKFNNCIHINEPKCAVKDALEEDKVSWSRYKSYMQIIEGEEEHYRTDIWE